MKIMKYSDNSNFLITDVISIVNGAHSLITRLIVAYNRNMKVIDSNDINQRVNTRNLLEYSKPCFENMDPISFNYPDTKKSAESDKTNANYNSGFAKRKTL